MYEQVRIVNTYACINETANSSPIIAKNNPNGSKVSTNITIPAANILYKNVDNIFIKVCPATTLAKSLIPKEKALAKYDTNSINTNKGTKAKGVPEGTKKEKKANLCLAKPKIVTATKIVKDKPIDTIIDVVIVYE